MSELTPERRAELRQLLDDHTTDAGEWCCDTLPQAAMDALLALLDAADERDRLAAAIERVRALAPVDVSDWDEDDPLTVTAADLHRALDGTEDGPTT